MDRERKSTPSGSKIPSTVTAPKDVKSATSSSGTEMGQISEFQALFLSAIVSACPDIWDSKQQKLKEAMVESLNMVAAQSESIWRRMVFQAQKAWTTYENDLKEKKETSKIPRNLVHVLKVLGKTVAPEYIGTTVMLNFPEVPSLEEQRLNNSNTTGQLGEVKYEPREVGTSLKRPARDIEEENIQKMVKRFRLCIVEMGSAGDEPRIVSMIN